MILSVRLKDINWEAKSKIIEEIKNEIKKILEEKAKEEKMSLKDYVVKNYTLTIFETEDEIKKNFESYFENWLEKEAELSIDEFETVINLNY